MDAGTVYRLKTPTLGMSGESDGRRIPITLPTNALLTVLDGDVNGYAFVDVLWEGKTVTMFAVDLRRRGEHVSSAGR
jgi:hypothetical protein